MKQPDKIRPTAPAGLFTKGEQRKLLLMTVALLVVGGAFVTSLLQGNRLEEQPPGELPAEAPVHEARVVVPEIDAAAIGALVADGTADDRVTLEREGVESLLAVARKLTPAHYLAMGARELNAELAGAILEAPDEYRTQAFTARGWLRRHRPRSYDGAEEHHLRLTLDDDTTVYAVTLDTGGLELQEDDSFVRLDGLLLKAFSDETPEGWQAGPLLVARTIERSFPALAPMTEIDAVSLSSVEDFSLQRGATGLPFDPLWRLMAHARDLTEDGVDWENARELNPTEFGSIMKDGEAHRGQPYRIPVSKLMGITVKRAPENPARIAEVTEGWIGNYYLPHLIHFRAPFAQRDYRWKDLVSARGFFFKNFAYDSKTKDVQVAPVFVLHSLERFIPPVDNSIDQLMIGVAIVTISFIGLVSFLVTRDRRRSRELQTSLMRRRRARREQAESHGRPQAEGNA